jgi:uncharacterized membrane protein
MKRNNSRIPFRFHKYQEKIFLPYYAACLLLVACLAFLLYGLYEGAFPGHFRDFAVILILTVSGIFLLLVFWAVGISSRILGPCERILADLERMVKEQKARPLQVRRGDEMFGELLKRINALLCISAPKSQGLQNGSFHKRGSLN